MDTAWTNIPSYGFRPFVRNLLIKLDKICPPTRVADCPREVPRPWGRGKIIFLRKQEKLQAADFGDAQRRVRTPGLRIVHGNYSPAGRVHHGDSKARRQIRQRSARRAADVDAGTDAAQ